MKHFILALCAVLLIGCETVQFKNKAGQMVEMPADMYAAKMQSDATAKMVSNACEDISKPISAPEGITLSGDSAAWAYAFAADSQGDAKAECARAMADIAESNKPTDYLKYKVAKIKAYAGAFTGILSPLVNAACVFNAFGACDGGSGDTSGNVYGDNWVFNQDSNGAGGPGAAGEAAAAPGGGGRSSNNVNFGHGNVMGSDLTSSISGWNQKSNFNNGDGGNDDHSINESFDDINSNRSNDNSGASDF